MLDLREAYRELRGPLTAYVTGLVGRPWLAEEVVQETFAKAQAKRETLADDGKAKAWLFTIARNQCLDLLRQESGRRRAAGEAVAETPRGEPQSAQSLLEQGQMSACVRGKLERLAPAQREIIALHDLAGLSHAEAAATLGISPGAAKVRLSRARAALRTILERDCVFEHDDRDVLVCLPREDVAGD